MNNQKVWVVTGAARGLGLEITTLLLAVGNRVIGTVRSKPEDLVKTINNKNFQAIVMDVTNEGQVINAIEEAIKIFGHIDVLVNNAGFGLIGAIEETSDEDIKNNYATNVFGLLNVTRAILPYFRKQRSGHIINMSSVAGLRGSAGWGIYASTKFAVEGISEALAKELLPLNIFVTAIEPGYFRTNFLDVSSLSKTIPKIDDYDGTVGVTRVRANEVNYKQPGDPAKLAAAIIKVANSANPPVHLPLGKDSLNAYRLKTAEFEKDIEAWYDVIVGTDL